MTLCCLPAVSASVLGRWCKQIWVPFRILLTSEHHGLMVSRKLLLKSIWFFWQEWLCFSETWVICDTHLFASRRINFGYISGSELIWVVWFGLLKWLLGLRNYILWTHKNSCYEQFPRDICLVNSTQLFPNMRASLRLLNFLLLEKQFFLFH